MAAIEKLSGPDLQELDNDFSTTQFHANMLPKI